MSWLIRITLVIITGAALGGAVTSVLVMHRGVTDILTGMFIAGVTILAVMWLAGRVERHLGRRERQLAEMERDNITLQQDKRDLARTLDWLANGVTKPLRRVR